MIIEEKILEFLFEDRRDWLTSHQIARGIKQPLSSISTILTKMRKEDKIRFKISPKKGYSLIGERKVIWYYKSK